MPKKSLYAGIFLISLTTLALEIFLVRFFSINQWYHFAFMVVSIVLFGIAASGTFLSIRKINSEKRFYFYSTILFLLSIPLGFFIVNKLSFSPYRALIHFSELLKLLFYYIFLGLPFFFFGLIISYTFFRYQKDSGKIYFYNLLGSSIGVLVAIPLICILNFIPLNINISEYKELSQALNYPNSKLLLTKYNSFSRVDVVNSSFIKYAPGLSSSFRDNIPEQIGILVDGAGMNAITQYKNLEFLDYLPNSIAFFLIKKPNVLVINSGAGLDVTNALYHNSTVIALESNPIIVDLLKNRYKDFSGNIYNKADVYIGEGRSFIKKGKKYDTIILSLAGNVLSSSAGLTSFSENYLLTVEAFKDYTAHLTDNGVLVITRWLLYPPRESLRLFSLALAVTDKENIAMFRSWQTVTLLLSKNKFDSKEINKIKEFTEKNKYDLIYLPDNFIPNKYAKFKEPYYYTGVNQILTNKEKFYNDYIFDIKPVYDDKPFYFNFFKWTKLHKLHELIWKWQPFFDSGFLLFFIFIQAFILSLIFILLPLIKHSNKNLKNKSSLLYFFCIGISFLFIEIVLIQKFILFFGQVIYSTTIIIFSLLLFSSIGSLISNRFKPKKLRTIIVLLAVMIIFYALFLPKILDYFIVRNLIFKIVFSIIMTVPLAFTMGMPFPLGVRAINKKLVPWSWAVNGCASVLSPILASLIALQFGYNFVLLLAAVIYLVGVYMINI